jgi:twitching motility protein PilJ
VQTAKDAADKSFIDSQDVLLGASRVSQLVDGLSSKRPLANPLIGAAAAAAAMLLLLFLGLNLFREQRRRLQATNELNQRNQDAILRLLDEMGSLAEGDLTVKATVTEDITGAIADSVNFAVEALRSLVTTINETAVQVSTAAQETQSTAMSLADAAQHQARQISSASVAINDMANSIDTVSKSSAESADVAQRSVQIAANGAQVVRQTIQGMDQIRDQIQETSKRIKRLGESSQEIGSIVELINDIAEQTNILALNAAMQAASAGEAGRGFAVVADEVQRLAERASGATRRIETLVQTIQSDTNEAVTSMEQTTSEVVSGARRAEDAGQALGEIENVSNNLASRFISIGAPAVGRGDEHHLDDERHSGDHLADLGRREPDRRIDRQPRPARGRPAPFRRRLQAAG